MNFKFIWILFLTQSICYAQAPNVIWSKKFYSDFINESKSVVVASDNNYVFVNASNCFSYSGPTIGDLEIIKTDRDGHTIWSKCYGGGNYDSPKKIISTKDKGFIALVNTNSNNGDVVGNHGNVDVWLVKLDSLGNVQWKRCYGGSDLDYGTCIIQTQDEGYLIGVNSYSTNGDAQFNNKGQDDLWLIKINSNGTIIWQKNFGGSQSDFPESLIETDNGDFIIGGYSISVGGDMWQRKYMYGRDCWVFRINSTGTLIWSKAFGGSGFSETINNIFFNQKDRTYSLIGWTESKDQDFISNGETDGFIIKIDENGNLIKIKTFGLDKFDTILDSYQTSNRNIILMFSSNSYHMNWHGNNDLWLVKISEDYELIWEKSYGGQKNDYPISMAIDYNHNLIFSGYSNSVDGDLINTNNITSPNHDYSKWFFKMSIDNDCYGDLFLFSNILGEKEYKSNKSIFVRSSVEDSSKLVLQAQNSIYLLPGFQTKNNVYFNAKIEDCIN